MSEAAEYVRRASSYWPAAVLPDVESHDSPPRESEGYWRLPGRSICP